jgi:hypothetical protein
MRPPIIPFSAADNCYGLSSARGKYRTTTRPAEYASAVNSSGDAKKEIAVPAAMIGCFPVICYHATRRSIPNQLLRLCFSYINKSASRRLANSGVGSPDWATGISPM